MYRDYECFQYPLPPACQHVPPPTRADERSWSRYLSSGVPAVKMGPYGDRFSAKHMRPPRRGSLQQPPPERLQPSQRTRAAGPTPPSSPPRRAGNWSGGWKDSPVRDTSGTPGHHGSRRLAQKQKRGQGAGLTRTQQARESDVRARAGTGGRVPLNSAQKKREATR